jgi:hypothetical protein
MAAAIAMAESGGNPNATNINQGGSAPGSADRGLWQINSQFHPAQSTYDPLQNAKGAILISNNGANWQPWCTAWSNGLCGGTYLGSGAPVFRYLPTSQGTQPQLVSIGGGGGGGGAASAPADSSGDTCALPINLGLFGGCLISKVNVRDISAVGIGLLGITLVIVGVAAIAVFSFGVNMGGPVAKGVGAVAKTLGKTKKAPVDEAGPEV